MRIIKNLTLIPARSGSKEIIDFYRKFEVKFHYLRPKRLSNDTVSALEVILYYINWIKKNYISVDNLIYLHPTSPTLKNSLIN